MAGATFWHRLQFGFTITYHYLFPQLTMGLALLLVVMKLCGRKDEHWNQLSRFWLRIFGINFAVGVVTGIPMEFQFGTNWANFSDYAGGVIGQTLAMEGMFSFFLESAVLGLVLFGEKKIGPRLHLVATVALCLGSWSSGYFIIVTNAFMQHPAGHRLAADGRLELGSLAHFLLNPWAIWQYLHNMCAAVVTGSFAVAAVGAFWMLSSQHQEYAKRALRLGVISGLVATALVAFPTGDQQGRLVAHHQPVALAAMEGLFESGPYAKLALIGQPDVPARRLENPVEVPGALSFLAYGSFGTTVTGLNDFPMDEWPDKIELLYYAYHVMVGLGTLLLGALALACLFLSRGTLWHKRWLLWVLMLAFPFPYIATTAGWMTAELGRQPWLVYHLLRTATGVSPKVSAGDAAFTTLGFAGLYLVVGLAFLSLVVREIARGPLAERHP